MLDGFSMPKGMQDLLPPSSSDRLNKDSVVCGGQWVSIGGYL